MDTEIMAAMVIAGGCLLAGLIAFAAGGRVRVRGDGGFLATLGVVGVCAGLRRIGDAPSAVG
ncbi:MAG: hypothetical protein FJX75_10685 [Armatimonadetes bacterium]|nr:hypothetical protein [Armatimonadota bacterium]